MLSFLNHINSNIMENFNMQDFARTLVEGHQPSALAQDLRIQAVKSLFDGLTFNQATTTSEWDTLTCNEQMTIEDLIG